MSQSSDDDGSQKRSSILGDADTDYSSKPENEGPSRAEDFGLDEWQIHDACRRAAKACADERRFTHPWRRWGTFSANFFAEIAEHLYEKGWAVITDGNSCWLRSPDKKYGLVVWPGNDYTGNGSARAKNARAKGAEARRVIEKPQLDLFDDAPASMEFDAVEGEDDAVQTRIPPEERPRQFIVLLYKRIGNNVHLELQLQPEEAVLSDDGYLTESGLRIFLRSIVVQSVPRPKQIDVPASPGVAEDLDVPMSSIDDPEGDE